MFVFILRCAAIAAWLFAGLCAILGGGYCAIAFSMSGGLAGPAAMVVGCVIACITVIAVVVDRVASLAEWTINDRK